MLGDVLCIVLLLFITSTNVLAAHICIIASNNGRGRMQIKQKDGSWVGHSFDRTVRNGHSVRGIWDYNIRGEDILFISVFFDSVGIAQPKD